ncbi:MAG: AAA family ATPase, partial [Patescibacteria group bacterium]
MKEEKGKGRRRERGEIESIELAKVKGEGLRRISSGIHEVDRVLGGGIVPGQVVLLAGEPGIGKSTLLSQIAEKIYSPSQRLSRTGGANSKKKNVLYVSGEESASQIKLRTERLGLSGKDVFVIEETDVDAIVSMLEAGSMKLDEITSNLKHQTSYNLIIIDSIQTLSTTDLAGMAGSVGQVRESAARLITLCKRYGIPLFLVGHVTKEGTIAGPRVLEHMVDTVLWFEGDRAHVLRLLRAVKNRFGPTDEVGIFTME